MTTPTEVLDRLAALAEKATQPHDKHSKGGYLTCLRCNAEIDFDQRIDPATVLALVAAVQAGMDLRSSPASYCGSRYDERQVSHEDVDAFDRAIAALAAPSTTTITKD